MNGDGPGGLHEFAHRHELVVTLRDLDALGHANNAAIVTYLEDARTEYLLGRRGIRDVRQFDFILARTEIDYRTPAMLHERIEVLIRPIRIGTKSFDLEYLVREVAAGRLIAEAKTVLVSFDFAKNVSVAIPEELRTLLNWDLELGAHS
ncbi:MAG: acyl-CoA thioesterase [Planctomycetes bacterium]|nr:acyl-CoA thioesterase [Planctomycetota bacterium]